MTMLSLALAALLPLIPLTRAATQQVIVGVNGTLRYSPEFVTAAIGDQIIFTFHPMNHTVTQSAFATPCVPLAGGADTGFTNFVPSTQTTDFPTQTFTVTDTNPTWFYCAQTVPKSHCENGMVFAINPPATGHTFAAFQDEALALGASTNTSSSTAAPVAVTTTTAAAASTVTVSIPPVVSLVTVTATVTVSGVPVTTTYGSYPGSAAPTIAAVPNVIPIQVGFNGTLTYQPDSVTANIGDIVSFEFVAKNHTATESSFNSPCVAALGSDGLQIFNTGFQPIAVGAGPNVVNFTVPDENPKWFYCAQRNPVDHCGNGMVFAINAPTTGDHTFSAFQELAIELNGTASSTPPSASASGSSTSTSASPSPSSKSGAITVHVGAGLSLGIVAALCAFLI